MLKIRVIPTLLMKNVGLVKGMAFDSWRRVGTVLPSIRVYNTREVDELILVDITATEEKREPDLLEIQSFSGDCFVPLSIGGGIRTIEHITRLLRSGADKVCLNTIAFEDELLVRLASEKFGNQCVVVSVDAKRNSSGFYECWSHSGRKATGKEVVDFCKHMESLGAGEILLTSIDRDGTMLGYDLDLIKSVTSKVNIPVIASGGAGSYQHMLEAVQSGASAVAAAAMFHFTHQTPLEAKKFLASQGVPVRTFHLNGKKS